MYLLIKYKRAVGMDESWMNFYYTNVEKKNLFGLDNENDFPCWWL
jgi:hypothetical protein